MHSRRKLVEMKIVAIFVLMFFGFRPQVLAAAQERVNGDYPWMDEMRADKVRLAKFTFEFDWTENGRKLSNWRCVSVEYFRDYHEQEKIIQPEELTRISATGLRATLEQFALSRAKTRNWFEYPRQPEGAGYVTILLADIYRELQAHAPSLYGAYEPGTTPLMHALFLNDTERARELLSSGADVNAVSANGSTALVYAAERDDPAILQLLLTKGAKVNAHTRNDGNALTAAVAANYLQNVKILLIAGANPNAKDAEGDTALKIAIENHYDDIAAMLIKAGAREQ